ncbi:hypothetical protein HDV01_000755 [Terramyces sp. JEL0728]|nr:hypothetical protein HDV01_000755 [Terramyces sp. JEL0728]
MNRFAKILIPAGLGIGAFAYYRQQKEYSVVFVLGGPGSGKGTQCSKLVKDYDFIHLSAGDLLREERNRKDSPVGQLINTYIAEGKIVPRGITIGLLKEAMKKSGKDKFLIDGFPRALDQAEEFEEQAKQEMLKRLLKRGETSGRIDDNIASIKKRFSTFHDSSYPVVEYYEKQGKVERVSCTDTVDGVYEKTRKIIEKRLK